MATPASEGAEAAVLMNQMYRYQRYIYDFTRKPYLLGRDLMIKGLDVPVGGSVLEIGCGTGRNLIKAAQLYPQCKAYGLDISAEMLVTARQSIARASLGERVKVVQADATDFDAQSLFGRQAFERIFISYSLSMIPVWKQVLAEAAKNLTEGSNLHIVDFGTCEDLPKWFKAMLYAWLKKFSVFPREDLIDVASEIAQAQGLTCVASRPLKGYATMVVLSR